MGAHHLGATPSTVSGQGRPAPERIGRYRVRGVLGEGGFGVVYLAEQEKPVRRQVAIKLLRAGRDNEQVLARFQRERQSLAWMEHPGIARVYETAELEDGRPYIVMELVNGLPITSYCDQSRLSVRARLGLMQQVCRAVQHAHTKGMIHRDLKPSNVLVTVVDGEPVAKIIDFGIAKPIAPHEGEQTVYTQLHQIVGTPGYMPPEQVSGDLGLDTRADVYSIGVMLYELLAGTMPLDPALFKGKTAAQAERIITEMVPPRPSTRVSKGSGTRAGVATARATDPEQLSRTLRGELDWVVMKCLEKSPARRYQSPAALDAELDRFLRGESVEAVPPSIGYRTRKFARNNRALVVSVLAIVLALTGGLASMAYGLRRANTANAKLSAALDEVIEKERVAQREAARSGAFSRLFVDDVLGAANPRNSDGGDMSVGKVLDKTVARIDSIEDPSVRADVEYKVGYIYAALGRKQEGYEYLARAVAYMDTDPSTLPEAHARALVHLALQSQKLARDDFGVAYLRRATEVFVRAFGPSDPRALATTCRLANAMWMTGSQVEATKLLEETIAEFDRVEPPGHETEDHLVALETFVQVCLVPQGRRDEHYAATLRCVEAAERIGSPEVDLAVYLGNFADAAGQLGKTDEGLRAIERALEIDRRLYGADSLQAATRMCIMGTMLLRVGRGNESEPIVRDAVAIFERTMGMRSEGTVSAISTLGMTLGSLKKWDEASFELGRAADGYEALFGAESVRTLGARSIQAAALTNLGSHEEAERMLLDTERRVRELGVAAQIQFLTVRRLVSLYDAWGRTEDRDRWKIELDRINPSNSR